MIMYVIQAFTSGKNYNKLKEHDFNNSWYYVSNYRAIIWNHNFKKTLGVNKSIHYANLSENKAHSGVVPLWSRKTKIILLSHKNF